MTVSIFGGGGGGGAKRKACKSMPAYADDLFIW